MSASDIEGNLNELYDAWPIAGHNPEISDNLDDLLQTLATQLYYIDTDISETREAGFLTKATGEDLEKLARPFGVERERGESDDRLRRRAVARSIALASNGTYDDVVAAVETLLQTKNFELAPAESVDGGAIELTLPSAVIDDVPFTQAEIQAEIDQTIPATATVSVVTDDTFVFAGTDSGAGWDEGRWLSTVGN
jgi:hypothetical protein